MIPEDWKLAMENEAASVKDVQWAQETQDVVFQGKRRKLLTDTLTSLAAALALAMIWMMGFVLVSRVAWHMDVNFFGTWAIVDLDRFNLLFLVLVLLTGLSLGRWGVQPGRVALIMALLPLLLWLISGSVDVQGVWMAPGRDMMSERTTDFAVYTLNPSSFSFAIGAAFAGFLSAWAGQTLRCKSLCIRSAVK